MSKKPEEGIVIHCQVEEVGSDLLWTYQGELVFRVDRSSNEKTDLRKKPPYYTMSPCPYCGVVDGTRPSMHEPLSHVDKRLGKLVE